MRLGKIADCITLGNFIKEKKKKEVNLIFFSAVLENT